MFETVYTEHLKGRKVLLETPTGFAVFVVKDFAFEQDKNIWVHFSDPEYAVQALFALGFKKVDNKSAARNDDAGPGEVLVQLITKFCRTGETLIVQDKELKASIEKNIGITCRCDGYDVGEVIWGIKNVLHAFIREEEPNITPTYCLPVSKGLQEALQYYLVNIPPILVKKTFITKFGFLCYLDMNLEGFPKELSRSYDKYVGIGDTIKDGLDYSKVLALALVPELVEKHDFSKTFSSDLKSKLCQAKQFQANRKDNLTMHDVEKIMGYLEYLLHVPHVRDKIIVDVKLMEATFHRSLNPVKRVNVCPEEFDKKEFRRVLLETPSGFAIFNVCDDVFYNPEDIWTYFADILDARRHVFALGFVSVDDKSVIRNSDNGPGDELGQLILRFCNAKKNLVVQDTQLKAVIESKLGVECCTGEQVVEEVIWGLKHVMPHFILQESNKITDDYFRPLSKQLLKDMETYRIHVSTSEITTDFINVFGYVKVLDIILEKTSKDLHTKCGCYISNIIVSEDDVTNASMIAKVAKFLVPEFKEEIGLPEIAGGLGSKLMDLPEDARKAIADCDKQEILKFLKIISDICKEKKRASQKLLEIEAQIGVARIDLSNEAVGKDGEGKTNTKGSNEDGGSGNNGETNNSETKPMENGRSANKGKRGNKGKRVNKGKREPPQT